MSDLFGKRDVECIPEDFKVREFNRQANAAMEQIFEMESMFPHGNELRRLLYACRVKLGEVTHKIKKAGEEFERRKDD